MVDGIAARHRLQVKQRRQIVEYAKEHGFKPASRHFGLDRRTIRTWVRRWKAGGELGLVPRYPPRRKRRIPDTTVELSRVARVEHRWGAPRTRVWLERVHNVRVNTRTIQRVFKDIGIPILVRTPRRRPKQLKLFEKDAPGDSVQVDVKVVTLGRERVFQYTALDDCTGYRILRLYPRQNQHASLHFLKELQRELPFPMRKLQCDNGTQFPLAFTLTAKPPAYGKATSNRVPPNRTVRSNAVTVWMTRNSGADTDSQPGLTLRDRCWTGNADTTTSGSPWHSTAAHPSRSFKPNRRSL